MHNYKFTTFFNIKYRLYLKSFEKTGVLVYKYFYRIHPNITSHNAVIKDKGCDALIKMVQAQVQVYEIENGTIPTLEALKTGNYITTDSCPGGNPLVIDSLTGEVTESATP